jgi:hypothetical protein
MQVLHKIRAQILFDENETIHICTSILSSIWALLILNKAAVAAIHKQYYLCKIWGFHGGDYEEWCLLGCYAVWLL